MEHVKNEKLEVKILRIERIYPLLNIVAWSRRGLRSWPSN